MVLCLFRKFRQHACATKNWQNDWRKALVASLKLVGCTNSLTHSLIHSLTHSITHSITHSLTHSLTHSPTHSSLSVCLSVCLSVSLSLSLSLSPPLCLTLSLYLSLSSLSPLSLSVSLSLSLFLSLFLSLSLPLSLSLSHPLSLCPSPFSLTHMHTHTHSNLHTPVIIPRLSRVYPITERRLSIPLTHAHCPQGAVKGTGATFTFTFALPAFLIKRNVLLSHRGSGPAGSTCSRGIRRGGVPPGGPILTLTPPRMKEDF